MKVPPWLLTVLMQPQRRMSLRPLFISNLLLFKLCVVSRCLSKGDKENERGLDIISIEMSLADAPSQTPLQRRFSPCAAFSTCKWQCHQMLSFHQSSQEVMNIQKAKQGLAASRSSTWPNYTDSAFSCEPPLFCFNVKGTVQGSPRLNQGRSCILDLSSGLQMQVKCGHQMSSFFYIIAARGQRQQGSVPQPFSCAHSATSHELKSSSLPKQRRHTGLLQLPRPFSP